MKTITYLLSFIILFSCTSVKQIGDINTISTRNTIQTEQSMELLASYRGYDKRTIKRTESVSLENAIDVVVATVPSGEEMRNVKVYLVGGNRIAVSGDVWGYPSKKEGFQGYKVGQKVLYKVSKKEFIDAEIISFRDAATCVIRYNKLNVLSGKTNQTEKEVEISRLSKK